ncbi:MAG: ATP-dependent helicase [Actinomycetia bacterium]|nr:ATP-dependent helicase [Actinomycetes bacterium]
MSAALSTFSSQTRRWFDGVFAEPTPAQEAAWLAISAGQSTLVVAPTGSGKTLAAFLWALDRCAGTDIGGVGGVGTTILYISPLKALAVDVERNLRAPLAGIANAYELDGLTPPQISVAIRTGDTPASERQRQLRRPSTLLITTPESLYLMLTSKARETLQSVTTVIVDEVHAVAGTKRGAHLALSLERLDALLQAPAQRIGLSATVRPTETVAAFLGGPHPVTIVQPPSSKEFDLSVVVPVEDLTALGDEVTFTDDGEIAPTAPSLWPHVESRIVDLVADHRSTIVFANSRRLTERLAARLNEEAARRAAGGGGVLEVPTQHDSPAQVMAQAGMTLPGNTPEIARAHHGSVSREQRADIEEQLKQGTLPAVVATSSLELGIDMGAVDLVIQVESPPSVASGLQRIGRSGHQVGGVSRGVLFPKHRGDLLPSAVAVDRMRHGQIEQLRVPRNPLDVLAQHVVAMVAMDDWTVTELATVVRRADPFRALPDSALHAVLDMLAGRYPSDAFAELKPRLVWDRDADLLTARPGAHRIAVINGGTIPDRGLYGVFLAGGGGPGRRVGELDEEMVYESRIGDVFALGSTSWQIVDITHDQVLVTPAPGRAGKLPFWHGDTVGRPREFGQAIGATIRQLRSSKPKQAEQDLTALGLDVNAASNALAYLEEQHEICGVVPDDRTIVIERFRDEIGDWRLVVHSFAGGRVNTPWALALAARLRHELDMDVQVMPSDDGIVLRLPDLGDDIDENAPDIVEHLLIDPDDAERQVTDAVWGSALFAARFRECSARALLLPRRRPDRRTPLWQQRQRSAQLLGVASGHPTFPLVLETMRECLQDVFDVPGLRELLADLATGKIRVVEVETQRPSPFARSLLFSYVGAFLYEGDAPLAERRAAALSVDTALLAELLGQAELRELLDPDAIALVERRVGWLTDERRLRDAEAVADALRVLGPLSDDDLLARGGQLSWANELVESRRAVSVRIRAGQRWVAVEDLARLRDALGIPLPPGVSGAFAASVSDPVGDLVSRYARTNGPFTTADAAQSLGLGPAVVSAALDQMATSGRVVAGAFRPGGSGPEWCDADVLRQIRRASLAIAQRAVEPVPAERLATFLPQWQGVGGAAIGVDGLYRVIEQLAGATAPASEWERSILATRVRGYQPAWLDQLTGSGDVVWFGAGALPQGDGWVGFVPAEQSALILPAPAAVDDRTDAHAALLELFGDGVALLTRGVHASLSAYPSDVVDTALWDLVWAGLLTNDSLAALRSRQGTRRTAFGRSTPSVGSRSPTRTGRMTRTSRPVVADAVPGRWFRVNEPPASTTLRAHATAAALLGRHGVLTRGSAAAEGVPGGFAATYRVLAAMEDAGRVQRGYFIEGLGAAQFAGSAAVDQLRTEDTAQRVHALAGTDPANPYGAALPWPSSPASHLPGRKAGATVIIDEAGLALFVERGGRSLLSWCLPGSDRAGAATAALVSAVRSGHRPALHLLKVDGAEIHPSPWRQPLQQAGFLLTPRGLRLRTDRIPARR